MIESCCQTDLTVARDSRFFVDRVYEPKPIYNIEKVVTARNLIKLMPDLPHERAN
jgi:hypothetical protein